MACRSDLLLLPSASGCPPDALWLWQASLLSSLGFEDCSARSKMATEWDQWKWQLKEQQAMASPRLLNVTSTV